MEKVALRVFMKRFEKCLNQDVGQNKADSCTLPLMIFAREDCMISAIISDSKFQNTSDNLIAFVFPCKGIKLSFLNATLLIKNTLPKVMTALRS